MILQCPECGAKFNVPDGAITEEGREVKCSKCAHVWHATPPDPDKQMQEATKALEAAKASAAAPEAASDLVEGDEEAGFPIDTDLNQEAAAEKDEAPAPAPADGGDIELVFEDKQEEPEEAEEAPAAEEEPTEEAAEEADAPSEAAEDMPSGDDIPIGDEPAGDAVAADGDEGAGGGDAPDGDDDEDESVHIDVDEFDFDNVELNYKSPYDKHKPMGGGEEGQGLSVWVYIVSTVVLVLAVMIASLFAFRTSLQTSIPFVYELMGMSRTDGLVLADIEFREKPRTGNKARFVVEGKIVNQSNGIRKVPILRVAIVDAEGEVIVSREYEADAELKPGEAYPFKASKLDTTFVDRVDHITVDLGNGAQLMLRD